jgi:ribosomal protein S18 acetylase RimI-like enzyme
VRDDGELLGCVDLIDDMTAYGAGGAATQLSDAVGVRLLAVAAQSRGHGVGRARTRDGLDVARALGRSSVVLHTTRAMQTAWGMYERLGFERFAALDFRQGNLDVFGFRLRL